MPSKHGQQFATSCFIHFLTKAGVIAHGVGVQSRSRTQRAFPFTALACASAVSVACVAKLEKLSPTNVTMSPESAESRESDNSPAASFTAPVSSFPSSVDVGPSSDTGTAHSGVTSSTDDGTPPGPNASTQVTSDSESSTDVSTAYPSSLGSESTTYPTVSDSTPEPSSLGNSDASSSSADDATTADSGPPAVLSTDAGLLLWLDADDGLEGQVATWGDRSGNGVQFQQTTVGRQPTRVSDALAGRAVLRFDGVDDSLQATAPLTNRAFDGFVVWRSTRVPPATKSTLLANARNFEVNHGHISSTARAAVSTCVGSNCLAANSGWYDAQFNPTAAANTAYLWHFGFSEDTLTLFAEAFGGTLGTRSGPAELPVLPATPLVVGNCDAANCGFAGDIAEIVLFDHTLPATDQSSVMTYLASKWDL